MAKPDKAQIKYIVGEGEEAVESTLRFHSVIAEDHEASTEITKFPVQTGFDVSNHAIRKNRKVSITGVVSNHIVIGAEEFHEYGSNNSRVMFSALKDLVQRAVPCEVQTNYDTYSPVIFTKFKTKLSEGKTDIMEFTMTGEEVMLGLSPNQTAPTLLVFTPLTEAEAQARRDELLGAGLQIPLGAILSEAVVDFNQSFAVEVDNGDGTKSTVTFDQCKYDPTSDVYSHQQHTNNTKVASPKPETSFNWMAMMSEEASILDDVELTSVVSTTSACLVDGGIGIIKDEASDLIDTAFGTLKKSIYGAVYGITGVNGNRSAGQVLISLGMDCLIAGGLGTFDSKVNAESFNVNSVPSVDDILKGASTLGDSLAADTIGVAAPSTITKVSSPTGEVSYFGDLL